jgi:hypothetical protein
MLPTKLVEIRPLAKLLYDTHFRQVFQSGQAAAASADELDAKDRSIPAFMLPSGPAPNPLSSSNCALTRRKILEFRLIKVSRT